jgi:DNA-binding winged helix-turn-helix (wHTH) protein
MGAARGTRVLEIGDAILCEERRELRRGDALVPVQPKVLDVLLYLVQNRHRVVSQPELLRGVWRDAVVTGASLARALKEARRALGDDGRGQRWIRTLPGRGYRFVGPVTEKAGGAPAAIGSTGYVGREALLGTLEGALDAAARSRGGVVLIEGPAGIGKTRTAEELMRRARMRGAQLAWSWCAGAQGAPPLWPWTRLLAGLGDTGRSLVPRGLAPQGGSGAPVAGAERFQLFTAIADRVVRAAARGLLVLAIDDLHEADAGSVAMLEFLAHELPHRPILVLATLRLDVAERRPDLERERLRLVRHGCVSHHAVAGLDAEELGRLVASRLGADPPPQVVTSLLASTRGNPFLTLEILRAGASLSSQGTPAWDEIVPRGLSQLLQDRLSQLAPTTRAILRCAALLGEGFDAGLLAAVVEGEQAAQVSVAIADAARDQVLLFGADGRPRFAHALFREALLAGLAPAERGALHARAAAALERGADAARNADAIARHWHAAGGQGDASRALAWARRAADAASGAFAWETAAQHLEHAQALIDAGAPSPPALHCDLLLQLAAAYARLGEREASRAAAQRAHAIACEHAWPDRAARAVLAAAGPPDQYRLPDLALSAQLEAAFGGLRAEHASLAARVLARRAAEHVLDADRAHVARLRGAAVDAALSCGDAEVLAEVLMTPYSGIWEGIEPSRRLALAEACVARGRVQDNANAEGRGAILRLSELLGRGELDRFDAEVGAAEAFTIERHEPAGRYQVLLHRATRALAAGELRACEAFAEEAFALGQRIRIAGAPELFATQITLLRREQGRLEELLAANTTLYRHHPSPSARILHVWGVAEIGGREEEARVRLAEAIEADVASLPLQATGVANAALLARVAFLLCDARPAAALRAVLLPHRDRVVLRGTVAAHGPGAYFLALLAWTEARDAEVQPLFEAALDRCRSMRASLWRAHVESDFARWLWQRGSEVDRVRARRLAARAARSATSIGARAVARSAESLLGEIGAAPR